MSIFSRDKKKKPDATKAGAETSPQKVGVVSAVLPTGADKGEQTPFSDVVSKRFGPSAKSAADADTLVEPRQAASVNPAEGVEHEHQNIKTLFTSEEPELETDPMANIGRATTITGNIVAEEDLEIHGTIEGSVLLDKHQVTVGAEGVVQASVEAKVVMVHGKITGDVTATELIEVKPGGIVGGDVKAPRMIMHDGAVIVGGLDMSAALPTGSNAQKKASKTDTGSSKQVKTAAKNGDRPVLKKVELPPVHAVAEGQSPQG
ncbi:MAG: polymer-forming cytoskeletal protein [Myxococcota bacterium]